ncbi:MAG: hypothetical protein IPN70_02035 [Candidatus Moraniibacteriota bacterium]|nr:MAG: hypothetical protein IPN70_02035 [Candidatus Moranbacteria bacterium]
MNDIINNIANKDRAIGWIVSQMYCCAKEEKWYPAIASLFMLLEQVLRWATDSKDEDTLNVIINKAKKDSLIAESEAETLHRVREYRNMYMHSNFHENQFEIDGLLYPVNDEETAEAIFNSICTPCLNIILKLMV